MINPTVDGPIEEVSLWFGFALDAFDGKLFVGSLRGGAYLFDYESGELELSLSSPAPQEEQRVFGNVVAGAGGMLAVSDRLANPGQVSAAGSVYLFDSASGAHQRTLLSPAPERGAAFGLSLEFSSGLLYVAEQDGSSPQLGRVHVFNPNNGVVERTLANPAEGWGFGSQIVGAEGRLFVSAPGSAVQGEEPGTVYRFDDQSSIPSLAIAAPFPTRTRRFGAAMDADDQFLLIGAPLTDVDGVARAGEAYLYDATSGELLFTLANPRPQELSGFGESVSLMDDYFVIGAPRDDDGGFPANHGTAYVYSLHSGSLLATIPNPVSGQNNLQFTDPGVGGGGLLGIGNEFVAVNPLVPTVRRRGSPLSVAAGSVNRFRVVPEPSSALLALVAYQGPLTIGWRSRRREPRLRLLKLQ